eukprot:Transcript_10191.p1 GENE.Transcript_10191~~Transcript_10191.p1  ORF type:complete len:662 (+),score=133.75 Transcript_10191:110-2095(+)
MQRLSIDTNERDFVLLEELHRSSGGSVFKARHRPTGNVVVIKERTTAELGGKGREAMRHELKLYEKLPPHKNVIGLLGAFWRGGSQAAGMSYGGGVDAGSKLAMVFEYADQGDLHRFLEGQRASGKYLSERQALSLFRQIAAGVQHLHANGVVHRDIKTLNIVLRDGVPKLCDLGISRFRSSETVLMNSFAGTPAYLSPEMVATQPYTEKTDVWALGVVLYELLALQLPFPGKSLVEISQRISQGAFAALPAHVSRETSRLVASALSLDPAARPMVVEMQQDAEATIRAITQRREAEKLARAARAADALARLVLRRLRWPPAHGRAGARLALVHSVERARRAARGAAARARGEAHRRERGRVVAAQPPIHRRLLGRRLRRLRRERRARDAARRRCLAERREPPVERARGAGVRARRADCEDARRRDGAAAGRRPAQRPFRPRAAALRRALAPRRGAQVRRAAHAAAHRRRAPPALHRGLGALDAPRPARRAAHGAAHLRRPCRREPQGRRARHPQLPGGGVGRGRLGAAPEVRHHLGLAQVAPGRTVRRHPTRHSTCGNSAQRPRTRGAAMYVFGCTRCVECYSRFRYQYIHSHTVSAQALCSMQSARDDTGGTATVLGQCDPIADGPASPIVADAGQPPPCSVLACGLQAWRRGPRDCSR